MAGGTIEDGRALPFDDGDGGGVAARSILYLSLALAVPAAVAVVFSKPLLGKRPLELVSTSGSLPWIELIGVTLIIFAGAYLATRHRYSFTYSAGAVTLACLAVYSFAHLYEPPGVAGSARFLTATRWTLWALPLALASWIRTVLVAADEALQSGDGALYERRTVITVVERWKGRRMLNRRANLGQLDLALYSLLVLTALLALIQPRWFFHMRASRDPWGGWVYPPTGWADIAGSIAIVCLFGAALFALAAWATKPRSISLHDAARLHYVGTAAWLASIASLLALGSGSLWPKPLLDVVFAVYFFGLAAAMVHAAATQERVRRQTTLERRVAGSAGVVAFAVTTSALVLPGHVVRAGALSALIAAAIAFGPPALRALYGFERPPVKNEADQVEPANVEEIEEEGLAAALRDQMATGRRAATMSGVAVDTMQSFVASLHEATHATAKPRADAGMGRPLSEIRAAISDKPAWQREMIDRIELLPAFAGTPQERLLQFAELVHSTALEIAADPRGAKLECDDPTGPATRTELFIAYSLQARLFPQLSDQDDQRRARYAYQAWSKGHSSWQQLLSLDLDELKRLARSTPESMPPGEDERRRRLGSRQLNLAAADIRLRWSQNLSQLTPRPVAGTRAPSGA